MRLKEHFDLVAIVLLALMFGVGQAPAFQTRLVRMAAERSPAKMKILRISSPARTFVCFR